MPDEAVEDQLRQARQALADAEGAREAELSDAVVINRCYYACFHAAQAVLYDRGHDPSSHSRCSAQRSWRRATRRATTVGF